MVSYKINQKTKKQNIKGIQKTRLIWLVSSAILLIPTMLLEPLWDGSSQLQDLVFFISWIMVLALFFYFSVPKLINDCEIKLEKDTINCSLNYGIARNRNNISLEQVRYFHETANGITLYSRWKKIWVPKSLKKYDELRAKILNSIHPRATKWYRLPTLWFWIGLGVFGLAASIINKDASFAYSAIVVSASGISFVIFFE